MGKVLLTLMPHHFKIPLIQWIIFGAIGASSISLKTNAFMFMDLQAKVQGGSIERYLSEHHIPGREGPIFQDMGGDSQPITISGSWIYENKPDDILQEYLDKFNNIFGSRIGWNWVRLEIMKALARWNMPMILATNLFVGPVILKKFDFSEVGGQPNVYNYSLILRELNPTLSLMGTSIISGFQLISGLSNTGDGMIRGF